MNGRRLQNSPRMVRTASSIGSRGSRRSLVLCIARGDGMRWPGVTVGLAADQDLRLALQKALLEQAHCGPLIRRLMVEGKHRNLSEPSDVVDHTDHALYYVLAERARNFDFLESGGRTIPLPPEEATPSPTLGRCVAAASRAGMRAAAVDVTSPDLEGGPFRVARAFARYMQPLDFGHQYRRLRSPRLTAPQKV